jgi:hypothetical protein
MNLLRTKLRGKRRKTQRLTRLQEDIYLIITLSSILRSLSKESRILPKLLRDRAKITAENPRNPYPLIPIHSFLLIYLKIICLKVPSTLLV